MTTLVFYDFEVTKYDWIMCECIPWTGEMRAMNRKEELEEFYQEHKDDVWVGYNSKHYDQYILKAILCDENVWECNNWIIKQSEPGWKFSDKFRSVPLIDYDVMPKGYSLKQLEGFMGHNINEDHVGFDINRPLTQEEAEEMAQYCMNDVVETMRVFRENIEDFRSLLWLVQEFGFPLSYMSKTKAQMSAAILECERTTRNDDFEIYVLDCIELNQYKCIAEWFLDWHNASYDVDFKYRVADVVHNFGWGGVHGAREKYHGKMTNDVIYLHVDVASYYPRLMIFHGLLTRNAKQPQKFVEIFNKRIELKKAGKKKEQAPLKIVINGTFGICKDKTNQAYDPRNANLICVNGQLMLVDLIDKLEAIPSFELIQSNTDGLIIKIDRKDFDQLDDICYEWESRCNMELGFDYIDEIWQKDVNNYIFRFSDGKYERKGSYVLEKSTLDNDLPILTKALFDKITLGVPIEKTINECDDLQMFQQICKCSSNYHHIEHGDKPLDNKCIRVFASLDYNDPGVYRVKPGRRDKFPDTSPHVFIVNDRVKGAKVPDKLDRSYYIEKVVKRYEDFSGVCRYKQQTFKGQV